MKKKRIWIVIVVLAAVLILAIVWLVAFKRIKPTDTNQKEIDESAISEQYTVTFYSNDGTILKIDSVEKGMAATPPVQPQMLYGTVFKAWDTDFSYITSNLDVYPICENVKEKTNVFAIGGAYGKSGGKVIVPIQLCGEVCVSAFDMTITYDSNALELVSVMEDGGVLYNAEVPGIIKLNYISTDNTVADVDVCCLEFLVKAQSGQSTVASEMQSIYAYKDSLESNSDELYSPEFLVLNGTVNILTKGE